MRRRWVGAGLVVVALVGGTAATVRLVQPGAALQTFNVGAFPYALALSGTGRAYVINRTTDWTGLSADGGSVSVVDLRGGTVVRRVPVGDDPRAIALDDPDARVFVANDDDASVSVLDTRSATTVRTTRVGSGPRALAVDASAHRVYVVSAGEDTLSILDARSGALLRTVRLGAAPAAGYGSGASAAGGLGGGASQSVVPGFGSVAVAALNGRVVVGSGWVITVLDTRSGAVLRSVQVGDAVRQLAADPRTGHVFIAGQTTVSLLDARHGWALRPVIVGAHPSALAVDTRRGRVLVADMGPTDSSGRPTGNGSVAVVDAGSAAIVRTISVGVAPMAVAVDERSGRAVVVNAGGPVHVHLWWAWLPSWLVSHLPFLADQSSDIRSVAGSVSVLSP